MTLYGNRWNVYDKDESERTMTIDETRCHIEYYNARWKWELPQAIQNYKTLIAEVDRLRRIL